MVRDGKTPPTTHIAIQEESDGSNTTWMEKVSDEQYSHGPAATQEQPKSQGTNNMNKEPSAIKETYGDFSPKLVQITDDVLFGDIWERPELSKRDRSLVTVTALKAQRIETIADGSLEPNSSREEKL
jgi:4-carboxymuconolactone decarboxylase